jgi:hypothetical protein
MRLLGRAMERRSNSEKLCLFSLCITVCSSYADWGSVLKTILHLIKDIGERQCTSTTGLFLMTETLQDCNTVYWLRLCYVFSSVSFRIVSLLLGTYEARGKLVQAMSDFFIQFETLNDEHYALWKTTPDIE